MCNHFAYFSITGDSDWSSSGSGSGSGIAEDEEPTDSFGDIYFSTPSSPIHFIPDHREPPKVSSGSDRWHQNYWLTFMSAFVLLLRSLFQMKVAARAV